MADVAYVSYKVHSIILPDNRVISLEDMDIETTLSVQRTAEYVHTNNKKKEARGTIQQSLEISLTMSLMLPQGDLAADFIALCVEGGPGRFKLAGLLQGGARRLITGCVCEKYDEESSPEKVGGSIEVKATGIIHGAT